MSGLLNELGDIDHVQSLPLAVDLKTFSCDATPLVSLFFFRQQDHLPAITRSMFFVRTVYSGG
jgi:hypothetical protein